MRPHSGDSARGDKAKDKPIEQKVARILGRAFARLKHAKPIRDAKQAYQDELEGNQPPKNR